MEVERFEREGGEFAREGLLLFCGQDARVIAKSFGQPRGGGEKIGLIEA